MKKVNALIAVVGLVGGTACSTTTPDGPLGASNAALSEVGCSYRTITAPNGTTLASWAHSCFLSQTSANASYGYSWCTNGYIWEITEVDTGTIPDRILDITALPATLPTNQTDCQNTHVGMYLYGLDPVNGPYNWAGTEPDYSSISGTWVVPDSGPFGPYCDFSAATIHGVDLDNWPDGISTDHAVGIRVVAQAYNGSTKENVTISISPHVPDGNYCVNGPTRQ